MGGGSVAYVLHLERCRHALGGTLHGFWEMAFSRVSRGREVAIKHGWQQPQHIRLRSRFRHRLPCCVPTTTAPARFERRPAFRSRARGAFSISSTSVVQLQTHPTARAERAFIDVGYCNHLFGFSGAPASAPDRGDDERWPAPTHGRSRRGSKPRTGSVASRPAACRGRRRETGSGARSIRAKVARIKRAKSSPSPGLRPSYHCTASSSSAAASGSTTSGSVTVGAVLSRPRPRATASPAPDRRRAGRGGARVPYADPR